MTMANQAVITQPPPTLPAVFATTRPTTRTIRGSLRRNLVKNAASVVDNIFDTVHTPCEKAHISNDEHLPGSSGTENSFDTCVTITEHGCVDTSMMNDSGQTKIDISFLYELHRPIGTDFDNTLSTLEWSILQHLAPLSGYTSCEFDGKVEQSQFESVVKSTTSSNNDHPSDNIRLSAVSSFPKDKKDPQWDSCVSSGNSGSDTITSSSSICQRMIGFTTIYVDESQKLMDHELIVDGILKVISAGMNDDSFLFGNVTKVTYIDAWHPDLHDATTQGVQDSIVSEGGLSQLAKGTLAGIGGFSLVILIVLVACRKRARKYAPTKKPKSPSRKTASSSPKRGLAETDTLALEPDDDYFKFEPISMMNRIKLFPIMCSSSAAKKQSQDNSENNDDNVQDGRTDKSEILGMNNNNNNIIVNESSVKMIYSSPSERFRLYDDNVEEEFRRAQASMFSMSRRDSIEDTDDDESISKLQQLVNLTFS